MTDRHRLTPLCEAAGGAAKVVEVNDPVVETIVEIKKSCPKFIIDTEIVLDGRSYTGKACKNECMTDPDVREQIRQQLARQR